MEVANVYRALSRNLVHLLTSDKRSYVYGADGARVHKQNADGTSTEYVNFNGQTIAEKDQAGAWTDYIYANGQKIAKTNATDHRIHLSGNVVHPGYELEADIYPTSPIVIRQGDTMCWQQYNDNAVGGLAVAYNNSTSWTGWQLYASDNTLANQDSAPAAWHSRCLLLDSIANQTISRIALTKDLQTQPGPWNLLLADLTLNHADGSVLPLPSPALYPQRVDSRYDTAFTATVEDVPTTADPIVSTAKAAPRLNYFFVADHLGSAALELSAGGWATSSTQFAPFGAELPTSTTGTSHYKFTGKERDTESGSDDFGARYYGSSMGRFMSPDPSGLLAQRPSDPQSWNLYAYARNNPLINIDPTGLDCVYANDAGNGVESIDHNSSSGECGGSGGSWVPGYADENWAHFNNNTNMFQVGSVNGAGANATVDYTTFGAGDNTGFIRVTPLAQDVPASLRPTPTGCKANSLETVSSAVWTDTSGS